VVQYVLLVIELARVSVFDHALHNEKHFFSVRWAYNLLVHLKVLLPKFIQETSVEIRLSILQKWNSFNMMLENGFPESKLKRLRKQLEN
jgi:hypothetical protein